MHSGARFAGCVHLAWALEKLRISLHKLNKLRKEYNLKTKNPKRGPLLIMDGERDHTVPWAIAKASYKKQRRNKGVTEIVRVPERGHSLTIDHGWREVADLALAFVQRFVTP